MSATHRAFSILVMLTAPLGAIYSIRKEAYDIALLMLLSTILLSLLDIVTVSRGGMWATKINEWVAWIIGLLIAAIAFFLFFYVEDTNNAMVMATLAQIVTIINWAILVKENQATSE